MWSHVVILVTIFTNDYPGLEEAAKEFAVEALVPDLIVEAFNIGIFPRATGFDVDTADGAFLEPVFDAVSNELGAVVATDMLRSPVLPDRFLYRSDYVDRPDGMGDPEADPLTGKLIEDGQYAETTSVVCLIGNKVPTPYMAGILGSLPQGGALAYTLHFALLLPYLKTLFAANPLHTLLVDPVPVPAKHRSYASITVTGLFVGLIYDASVKLTGVIACLTRQIRTRTGKTKSPASLGLPAQTLLNDMVDRPALGRRAYHFFEFTSLSMSICTAWSAMMRFRRDISSVIALI